MEAIIYKTCSSEQRTQTKPRTKIYNGHFELLFCIERVDVTQWHYTNIFVKILHRKVCRVGPLF